MSERLGHPAVNDAPRTGDIYRWAGDPSATIRVITVGRKYARIEVTQANGASWIKRQPMPFVSSFTRVLPPAMSDGGDPS